MTDSGCMQPKERCTHCISKIFSRCTSAIKRNKSSYLSANSRPAKIYVWSDVRMLGSAA